MYMYLVPSTGHRNHSKFEHLKFQMTRAGGRRGGRRGAPAPAVKCKKCKGPTIDQTAAKGKTCVKCKVDIVQWERIHTCKDRNCGTNICHYCASGQKRPKKKKHAEIQKEAVPEVELDPRGAAFDGVPKKKKNETVQERRTRERREVTARQKQRILDAQTHGLGPILKEDKITDLNKSYSYLWKEAVPSACFGGVMTPYVRDDSSGVRFYEAADINACDPAGIRRSFRRFQELHLKDGVLERLGLGDYRGNNIFVVQWISLRYEAGKPVGGAVIWVSFWEHINKQKNKISNTCMMLTNTDIDATSDHVHPFKAEDTHLVAHTRRGWALKLNEYLQSIRPKEVIVEQVEPDVVIDMMEEKEDQDESASVRALKAAADKKKADEAAAAHQTRLKFKNSQAGKEVAAAKAAKEKEIEVARKAREYDDLVATLASVRQNLTG
jgi:hypothetical protein